MNQLKNYLIPDKFEADIFGLGFENIKSSVGVNVELWRHVDDTTQRCFAQVLFSSSNNNLWTTSGGADPPFSSTVAWNTQPPQEGAMRSLSCSG